MPFFAGEEDDDVASAARLVVRLLNRKGPWFRVAQRPREIDHHAASAAAAAAAAADGDGSAGDRAAAASAAAATAEAPWSIGTSSLVSL
jgi:hypothetical protein